MSNSLEREQMFFKDNHLVITHDGYNGQYLGTQMSYPLINNVHYYEQIHYSKDLTQMWSERIPILFDTCPLHELLNYLDIRIKKYNTYHDDNLSEIKQIVNIYNLRSPKLKINRKWWAEGEPLLS